MFIKQRLDTLASLVKEYNLSALVRSDQNGADLLTRVPQRWQKYRSRLNLYSR